MNNSGSLIAFFSFVERDDKLSGGLLSQISERIGSEVSAFLGIDVKVYNFKSEIHAGTDWRKDIAEKIGAAPFLIPVITPFYFQSQPCREELSFYLRESADRLSKNLSHEIVFPIAWRSLSSMVNNEALVSDPLLKFVETRQEFSLESHNSKSKIDDELSSQLSALSKIIADSAVHDKEILADLRNGKKRRFTGMNLSNTPSPQQIRRDLSTLSGNTEEDNEDIINVSLRSSDSALLGPNMAQDDENLESYFIKDQMKFSDPIVTGRWGTGKTSIIVQRVSEIRKFLEAKGAGAKRWWYLEEKNLNLSGIKEISNSPDLRKTNEHGEIVQLWLAEIRFRVLVMLQLIYEELKQELTEPYWKEIIETEAQKVAPEGIWAAAGKIRSSDHSIQDLRALFWKLNSEKFGHSIIACCKELASRGRIRPMLAVEPIETPYSSAADDDAVANILVSSLLTCWHQFFRGDISGGAVQVSIAIPWHRYVPHLTVFPDKILMSTSYVQWEKSDLFKMINRRIEWEMYKARYYLNDEAASSSEVWYNFFPDQKIDNQSIYMPEERHEESFDYLCRHSSWRARDLIILVRETIRSFCRKNSIEEGEFFSQNRAIDSDTIRDSVRLCAQKFAAARILEYRKKFGFSHVSPNAFNGIHSPTSKSELVNKFLSAFGAGAKLKSERDVLQSLWEAEIIGLMIEFPVSSNLEGVFTSRFGVGKIRSVNSVFRGEEKIGKIGFLYRYNTIELSSGEDGGIYKYMALFPVHSIVFNPVFHEHLGISVSGEFPIGT